MDEAHFLGEACIKAPHRLRGERNLRYQNNGAFAPGQGGLNGMQVDLGFARTGDPHQQVVLRRGSPIDLGIDLLPYGVLVSGEARSLLQDGFQFGQRVTEDLAFANGDKAKIGQSLQVSGIGT
ncbi:hypothetical protein SDC9_90651 [bioreactor metagenome]|uniref:Uncharacterized protein n=1 Tax=bioreactor metagenome TaxID=1076179 RepID=A0A644ZZC8_9ZZZZ